MVLVYQRTGSAAWTAAVAALTYIPDLLGTLGLSWLADRYPRRAVAVGAAVVQAAAFATMALPGMPVLLLAALVTTSTIGLAPYRAAAQALLNDLITSPDDRLSAQTLLGFTRTVGQVAGLAVGGTLVVILGPGNALLLNSATFITTATLIGLGVPILTATRRGSRPTKPTRTAMALLLRDRRLRNTTGLMCLAGITAVPDGVAAYLADQLAAGPTAVGWLLAAHPVGMMVGMPLVRVRAADAARRVGPLIWTALLPLPALVVAGIVPSVWVVVGLLVISGVGLVYHPVLQAEFQHHCPPELRASVGGLARMALRLSQGGGLLVGGLAAQFSGSAVAACVGAGFVGCGLAVWVLRGRRTALAQASA